MKLEDIANPEELIATFRRLQGRANDNGCQEWLGKCRKDGYGYVYVRLRDGKLKRLYAHRLALVIANGEIGDKSCACHKCNNTSCTRVGPKHLYEGDQKTNVADAVECGAMVLPTPHTHCKRGHPFTPENTYFAESTGAQVCRTCRRQNSINYRRRKADLQGVQYGVIEHDERGRWVRKYPNGWDATVEEITAVS